MDKLLEHFKHCYPCKCHNTFFMELLGKCLRQVQYYLSKLKAQKKIFVKCYRYIVCDRFTTDREIYMEDDIKIIDTCEFCDSKLPEHTPQCVCIGPSDKEYIAPNYDSLELGDGFDVKVTDEDRKQLLRHIDMSQASPDFVARLLMANPDFYKILKGEDSDDPIEDFRYNFSK